MKSIKSILLVAILTIFGSNFSNAQNLGSLLGGDLGNTIGNFIEGVFSSSNITIADMTGEWDATGPAVCFQGEGFLKKAGGAAAAAAVETKLQPYYEQYGLNNATLTIDNQGNFTLVCKMIKLSGTITQSKGAEPGVFEFNFTALGMKLTSVTTYVQKTSSSMDIMFDATKLKKLITAVASFTGIDIVKTLSGILDSYDGLAVGFHFKGTSTGTNNQKGTTGSSIGSGLGSILGGFGIGTGNNSNSSNESTTPQDTGTDPNKKEDTGNSKNINNSNENTEVSNPISNGLNILRGLLGGSKK